MHFFVKDKLGRVVSLDEEGNICHIISSQGDTTKINTLLDKYMEQFDGQRFPFENFDNLTDESLIEIIYHAISVRRPVATKMKEHLSIL